MSLNEQKYAFNLEALHSLLVFPPRSELVNEALLQHFTQSCDVVRHFLALKRFLLLEDGEFGHALSTRLCEQLTYGGSWRELASPAFLNPLLTGSLAVSLHGQTTEASQLGFALSHRPRGINPHGSLRLANCL